MVISPRENAMPCNYKMYPRDWKKIRAEVLERAGNCCEGCRVPNHKTIVRNRYDHHDWSVVEGMESEAAIADGEWVVYIVLTIAHIDHSKPATRDNLRAWCQLCHNRHDVEHRKHNRAQTVKAKRSAPLFEKET